MVEDAMVDDEKVDDETQDSRDAETRRSLRDMGALLALPALWVDHEPLEIATGLLSVLFGILRLDGACMRLDGAGGEEPLDVWRPSGAMIPPELAEELVVTVEPGSGIVTRIFDDDGLGVMRVARVPIALPWERGLVAVSARRSTFPTEPETHLLRVAVGQGTIAIHAARRHRRERVARLAAEEVVARQNELLRSITDNMGPTIASISRQLLEVARLTSEIGVVHADRGSAASPTPAPASQGEQPPLPLTRRELEVLGLLAQGLSNREIAGVMWLSDRTVERHITNVYRKIGVGRRSEATAFALRHGVVQLGTDHPKVKQ